MSKLTISALRCIEQQDDPFWNADTVYLMYFSGKLGNPKFKLRAVHSQAWSELEAGTLRKESVLVDSDFDGDVNLVALIEQDAGRDLDKETIAYFTPLVTAHWQTWGVSVRGLSAQAVAKKMIHELQPALNGDVEGFDTLLGNDEQIGRIKQLAIGGGRKRKKLQFNGNSDDFDGGVYRVLFELS